MGAVTLFEPSTASIESSGAGEPIRGLKSR
jgi:hypothetical protein